MLGEAVIGPYGIGEPVELEFGLRLPLAPLGPPLAHAVQLLAQALDLTSSEMGRAGRSARR
ncbi:MAG: hypothetical protein R2695_01095 [Acidimicrobiales bacterium]